MAALQSLPEAYDENVYNRFMDTWGTHVAKDTLVGGMFEQQIVMKDCVWQNPYLTGGLTQDKLEEYLTMDLANTPPQVLWLFILHYFTMNLGSECVQKFNRDFVTQEVLYFLH